MSQDENESQIAAVGAAKSEKADVDVSRLAETLNLDRETRGGQIGEGSYEGARDYAASIDNYMRNADIDDAIQSAAPNSASDEAELLRAEAEGASRTKAPGE